MLRTYFKRVGMKRILMMLLGNLLLGVGIGIFKTSSMGNAPYDAMNMALSSRFGLPYAPYQVMFSLALLIIQLFVARRLIGIGTIANMLITSYVGAFVYQCIIGCIGLQSAIPLRLLFVIIGVPVTGLGLSFYQTSDVGISPYDALAIIMDKKLEKVPYFWCRMITDGACVLVTFCFGGIVGLGTVATVFGLGPVIHFFNKHFTERVLSHSV